MASLVSGMALISPSFLCQGGQFHTGKPGPGWPPDAKITQQKGRGANHDPSGGDSRETKLFPDVIAVTLDLAPPRYNPCHEDRDCRENFPRRSRAVPR